MPRIASYRQLQAILADLGYWLDRRDGGHLVYKHERHPIYVLPVTPSDHRALANDIATLRRRHPKAKVFQRQKKAPATDRKARRRRGDRFVRVVSRSLLPADWEARDARPLKPERPERTSCGECGRPWLSDLDPLQHCCPDCGGEHILGRENAA